MGTIIEIWRCESLLFQKLRSAIMSSGGTDPKAATQAANQDMEGESSEQLTQFVSDNLTLSENGI